MRTDMKYISIDPAKQSGVALWDADKLAGTGTIKPCGNKGKYWKMGFKVASKYDAYNDLIESLAVLDANGIVFIEFGTGGFHNANMAQAGIREYIKSICDRHSIKMVEIRTSEWRRVIREDQNLSWPAGREAKKSLSVKLVKQLYGIDVCDDVADAVLIGRAAQRMGMTV